MSKRAKIKDVLAESGLWVLSNAICVAFPVSAVYLILHVLLGMSLIKVTALMTVAAILTTTWGSWSAQIWTKNRGLRTSMRVLTALPGITLGVIGGLGLYFNFASFLIWLALIATGIVTVALAFMLSAEIAATRANETNVSRATGVLLFPLGATAMSSIVGYLWYGFFSTRADLFDWGWLFNFGTYAVTTLAFVLISTVIPASMSLISRRLIAPE
jgi:phage shock protein PspC (stress-responsive transcriptional regulator)